MRLMGVSRAEAEAMVEAPEGEPEVVEVLPVCWPALRLFRALAGQWRLALVATQGPAGPVIVTRPVAIDMGAIDAAARWLGLTPSPDLLADLQILEAEALDAMAAS